MAESTREKITRSARGLFALHGYRSTTVDEIARGARVSKRTVYENFASKEDIAHEVVDTALTIFQDKMRLIIQSGDDPLSKLGKLSRFYAALPAPQLSSKALIDLQRDLPELWKRVERVENGILEEMHQVIDEGKAQGVFRADADSEIVIGALTGALRSTMEPEFLLNSSHSVEEVTSSLFELVTLGIMANPPGARRVNKIGTAQGAGRKAGKAKAGIGR